MNLFSHTGKMNAMPVDGDVIASNPRDNVEKPFYDNNENTFLREWAAERHGRLADLGSLVYPDTVYKLPRKSLSKYAQGRGPISTKQLEALIPLMLEIEDMEG